MVPLKRSPVWGTTPSAHAWWDGAPPRLNCAASFFEANIRDLCPILQAETLRNLRDMLADVLSRVCSQPAMGNVRREEGVAEDSRGRRVLLLVALARCVESMAILAPLKVTAGSGVLGAVPLLLAEASEDDLVQLAAVDLASAVIARRESLPIDTPEGNELWALVREVLGAAAGRICPKHKHAHTRAHLPHFLSSLPTSAPSFPPHLAPTLPPSFHPSLSCFPSSLPFPPSSPPLSPFPRHSNHTSTASILTMRALPP